MSKIFKLVFSIKLFLFMSFVSLGQNSDFAKIDFKEYDLENGLHVIFYKDNTNPIVSVNIWYHVGSKDEDSGRTGFAHLFEHMMFQGSANVGKTEHFNYIQNAGGTLNGTTNNDRTNYFATVPSNQLELLLWLESDRMSTLQVTQENFDNQREVVKEEKRQRYDNAPYGSRWKEMMKRLFKEQTYEWTPIGSMEDLNSADLHYAKNFYKKYYSPDNAVLVVSGDFEYETAEKLVKKYFGDIKPSGTIKRKYNAIIFNQGEIIETIYDNVQLPAVYIGYKIPGTTHKDIYALTLLTMALGDGKSSRLYNEIVYNKKTARTAGSFLWDNELGGMAVITSTAFKYSDNVSLLNDIDSVINKISREGISSKELEKVKNSIEHDYVNMMQSTLRISDELAHYYTFFKNTGLINTSINEYMKITADDIKAAAQKYLVSDNRVVLKYLPKKQNKK